MMKGPNLYVVAPENCPAVAKAIKTFAEKKENAKFVIKGGVMGAEVIDLKTVMALGSVPSREELLAKLVGCLSNPMRGLAVVLSELAKKKEQEAA